MILPKANTPVSPKVIAGANWSGYATLILTLLGFVTPDSLAFLGHWAPLVYGLVIAATYAVGAYLKADPLRVPGAVSAADPVPAATTFVVNNAAAPVPADPAPAAPAVTDPAPAGPAAPAAQ